MEKISRFIKGLTAEDTNSQISQNRARLCAFKIATNPSEPLADLEYCINAIIIDLFLEFWAKNCKILPKKPNKFFDDPHTHGWLSSKKLCVLSLVYNSTTPLSAVFVWGFKFTNGQLDRKTFEVDKWASSTNQTELPTRQ